MRTPTASGPSDLGLDANVGGALCYAPCCIGLVVSIVAMVIEKKSRFVRFAALQSLLLHLALIAIVLVIGLPLIFLTAILGPFGLLVDLLQYALGLATLILMVFLLVKTYQGELVELPVIGDLVKKMMES